MASPDRRTKAQQRLQEMAKDYQPLVSAQSVREQRAEIRARADACELGAQCVALVQQLAQFDERRFVPEDPIVKAITEAKALTTEARQLTTGGDDA